VNLRPLAAKTLNDLVVEHVGVCDQTILEAGGLRVEFQRRGDRWGHRIAVIQAGRITPLLESVEGTADEDWPASPALQELHLEKRAAAPPLILLVGMAGRSHWSASVEIELASPAGKVIFDVACRTSAAAEPLKSTYRLLTGATVEPVENLARRITAAGGGCSLQVESPAGAAAGRIHAGRDVLAIESPPPATVAVHTIRWKYVISAEMRGGPQSG
jgi:hypothetical protein